MYVYIYVSYKHETAQILADWGQISGAGWEKSPHSSHNKWQRREARYVLDLAALYTSEFYSQHPRDRRKDNQRKISVIYIVNSKLQSSTKQLIQGTNLSTLSPKATGVYSPN
jgi:hypothetical protein